MNLDLKKMLQFRVLELPEIYGVSINVETEYAIVLL